MNRKTIMRRLVDASHQNPPMGVVVQSPGEKRVVLSLEAEGYCRIQLQTVGSWRTLTSSALKDVQFQDWYVSATEQLLVQPEEVLCRFRVTYYNSRLSKKGQGTQCVTFDSREEAETFANQHRYRAKACPIEVIP